MPKQPPSAALRAQLRDRIINRITELELEDFEAAEELGLSPGQTSRLRTGDDVFAVDRLIDAAANIGIAERMTATRPHHHGWRIPATRIPGRASAVTPLDPPVVPKQNDHKGVYHR